MFPNKSFISVVEEGRETGGSDYLQGQTGNCRFTASVRKRLYSHDFFQINEWCVACKGNIFEKF